MSKLHQMYSELHTFVDWIKITLDMRGSLVCLLLALHYQGNTGGVRPCGSLALLYGTQYTQWQYHTSFYLIF